MVSSQELHERNLVESVVDGLPEEHTVYGIFIDFMIPHKTPSTRFTLSPQLSLKWWPEDEQDQRKEIPDFGIGIFTKRGEHPRFKLRCGVEIKRAIEEMTSLPSPDSLINDPGTLIVFHTLYFQAQDQAKAAYKNRCPLSEDGIDWLLVVGPYWTPVTFGPFSDAEVSVRAYKLSDSGDHVAMSKVLAALRRNPRRLQELYILNSDKSFRRLGQIFRSTDHLPEPYITATTSGNG
jgi:hypothetical protein